MNKRRLLTQTLAIIFLLLMVESAHSAAAFSNLGAPHTSATCGKGGGGTKAEGFTTGADGQYTLTSVTYTLIDAGGTFTVALFNDVNGTPDLAIATIDTRMPGSTGGDVDYTFTPAVEIKLDSNTTYWLVTTSSACARVLADSGEEPTGAFIYVGSKVDMGTSLATGKTIWSELNATQAGIFKIDIAGGVFTVEVSASSAEQNKNFTYSFCVENSNPSLSANMIIETDIPTGTTFVSASGSNSVTPLSVFWNISNIQAGDPRQCVNMVVSVEAAAGSNLVINASITGDQPFIPGQISTTTTVVAPVSNGGGGSGAFGLLELFAVLLVLAQRRNQTS